MNFKLPNLWGRLCAEGTFDNSPAFQRWDRPAGRPSPEGTAEFATSVSAVPSGLGRLRRPNPALKRWAIIGSPFGTGLSTLNPQLSTSPPPAFTLIEVLLAVAIFSIVLLAIHTVFYGAVRLRNKTTSAVEAALPLQQTLAIMKRDLANVVMPGGKLFGELQTTSTATNDQGLLQNTPMFISTRVQVSPYFYTATGLLEDDLPWGEVQKVCYFLAQPTNNTLGRDLIRTVTRNLLPALQDEPEDQWLMSGVEDVLISYYDGTQWIETWDSTTETNKLPQAVKVELQLAENESGRVTQQPIQLLVPLAPQVGTNQTAQSSESSGGAQ